MEQKSFPCKGSPEKIRRPYRTYMKWVFHVLKETRRPLAPKEIMEKLSELKKKEYEKPEGERHINLLSLKTDYKDESARRSLQNALKNLSDIGCIQSLHGKYAIHDYKPIEEDVAKIIDTWQAEFKDKPYVRPLWLEDIIDKLGRSLKDRTFIIEVEKLAKSCGWLSNNTQRFLLEHSKVDLRSTLKEWLRHLEPEKGVVMVGEPLESFCGLARLDLYDSKVCIFSPEKPGVENPKLFESLKQLEFPFAGPDVKNLNLLKQHLETGGQEVLEKWQQLCNDAEEFLKSAKELAERIVEKVESEVKRLDLSLKGGMNGKRVFVRNSVSHIYRVLKGENVDLRESIRESIYDIRKAEDFADFLRQQIMSMENREMMNKINKKREELEKDTEEFRKLLREIMRARAASLTF